MLAQTERDGFCRESRCVTGMTSSRNAIIASIAGWRTMLAGSERTNVFAFLSIPSQTLPAGKKDTRRGFSRKARAANRFGTPTRMESAEGSRARPCTP